MGATSADNAGIEAIRRHEGFSPIAYRDTGGKWTIGYGHLIKAGEEHLQNAVLDRAAAEQLFRADLRDFEGYVNQYVTREKSQDEFNALLSLVYNIGPGNFRTTGIALKAQQRKPYSDLAPIWLAQNRDSTRTVRAGLTKRREAELAVYYGADRGTWVGVVLPLVGLALLGTAIFAYWKWSRKK